DIAAGDNSGYAKVYKLSSGTWNQVGNTIYGVTGDDSDNLGYALSFSDSGHLAVGAPFVTGSGRSGCVAVYDFSTLLATTEWEAELNGIWPNPVESILYVNNNSIGAQYYIKDLLGKVLLKSDIPTLDLRSFSSGVYLLEISNGNQKLTRKIIKK
ncbi:MAG TPA: T9SS type A sorting domain-containing protein, partial [Flavobacterium sp.]|nr:T9SS type A sorting domain-containing protein [Flavobacterium sp.]